MVCEEECNVRVSFMHPKVPEFIENSFSWPTKDDNCYFPDLDILGRVSVHHIHLKVYRSTQYLIFVPNSLQIRTNRWKELNKMDK